MALATAGPDAVTIGCSLLSASVPQKNIILALVVTSVLVFQFGVGSGLKFFKSPAIAMG